MKNGKIFIFLFSAKVFLRSKDFVSELFCYKLYKLNPEMLELMEPYTSMKDFNRNSAEKIARCISGLCIRMSLAGIASPNS